MSRIVCFGYQNWSVVFELIKYMVFVAFEKRYRLVDKDLLESNWICLYWSRRKSIISNSSLTYHWPSMKWQINNTGEFLDRLVYIPIHADLNALSVEIITKWKGYCSVKLTAKYLTILAMKCNRSVSGPYYLPYTLSNWFETNTERLSVNFCIKFYMTFNNLRTDRLAFRS